MAASPKPRGKPRTKRDQKSIRLAFEAHGGNISAVAEQFGVVRQTVYNWIEKYGLRDLVEFQRDKMFDLAERNINLELIKGSFEASKFVLTHFPTERRWSSRSEFTGKDGEALFLSAEVREAMQKLGLAESDVVREFEALVLAEAAKAKD